MEPRPHERGKVTRKVSSREKLGLQWSHVLTNVERSPRCDTSGHRDASMEPRPHERGKNPEKAKSSPTKRASMEPRPHERGKARVAAAMEKLRAKLRLQWSHVLTNVERYLSGCLV